MLAGAYRYAEAVAIYEEQLKLHPEDPALLARLAHVLNLQAHSLTDSAEAKKLNKRARELAEKAEKLGTTDPLSPLLLREINPDGSIVDLPKGSFSRNKEVDESIRKGEAAFGRHDYAGAIEHYRKAAELEPINYSAALWTGDAYFASKQLEPACEWFQRAIAISPDIEIAHRYLGDALAGLGRREEAYNEWIAALICEPYARLTRQHFTEKMRQAAESRGRVIPRFPAMRSTMKDKQIHLAVSPDDGLLIMAYNVSAVGWREAEFSRHFPKESSSRRSLPEEIAAINAMLEVAEVAKPEDKAAMAKWRSVVDGLTALKQEGLLESFVFFERADQELVKDYVEYRAQHRAELHRYVWKYWCGFD
ncbi:MAG: tetratricopeptide repeat protein [Nibricoccus sp.]